MSPFRSRGLGRPDDPHRENRSGFRERGGDEDLAISSPR